jgi:O-antigen ligase
MGARASPRQRIASIIETTGKSALYLGIAFVILVALLLTGSRGGVMATGVGLVVLAVMTFRREAKRMTAPLGIIAIAVPLLLITGMLWTFGDIFLVNVSERGISDNERVSVYLITLRSILDAPLLGHGYGTFADVFPMYRDRSVSIQDAWAQAHDTYVEIFQGLGVVFGSMLLVSMLLLVIRCAKGATVRKTDATVPRVAVASACLVGVHALVDFSLQIQAVALTFVALLGAGFAQSESSRCALND